MAIRSVVLRDGKGELGIGSGVVADSDPAREYDECRLKARFLVKGRESFRLLETLRWENGGFFLLERHLERLRDSAAYFGFLFEEEKVRAALRKEAQRLEREGGEHRVRLLLSPGGGVSLTSRAIGKNEVREPVRITIHPERVSSADRFLYHKTTRRGFFDRAYERARKEGFDECVFVNERGELTEGSRTNLFLEDPETGKLLTPPVSSGLLAGTLRAELLQSGRAVERALTPDDLKKARRIYVGNSVRGLLRAVVEA